MKVDDVLITEELSKRKAKEVNLLAENAALVALSTQLTEDPRKFFKKVVAVTKALCGAESVGLSLLRRADNQKFFHWDAIAGSYKGFVGATTPREFSPCGKCLDRGGPQLYDRPGRFFTYLRKVKPDVVEVLIVPIYAHGEALGTVWIVSHSPEVRFDMEECGLWKRPSS